MRVISINIRHEDRRREMTVRDVIRSEFDTVAREQGKTLHLADDDSDLLECGLDSLCFAILVARLEDKFGRDPFSNNDVLELPTTFGEFVRLYETLSV